MWRWLDPFDTLGRLGAALGAGEGEAAQPAAVTWAVPAALAWVWYLVAFPGTLSPRAVAAALLAYAVVTVAGGAAAGRRPWLGRAEVFGLIFDWVGRTRRGVWGSGAAAAGDDVGLDRWVAPRHAEVVLGVLGGGLLFGSVRASKLWGQLNTVPRAGLYAAAGLLFTAAAGAAVLHAGERAAARHGAPGAVAAAATPAVAAVAIALAMARNRLFTSVQLLPSLLSDPLGRGWDLLGAAALATDRNAIDPNPLGDAGRVAVQVAVLVAGAAAGVVIARRRSAVLPPQGQRAALRPVTVAVGTLLGAATLAVTAV